MATKNIDLIYIGNVSILINTDSSDYNTENAAALFGTYGSASSPFWERGMNNSIDVVDDVDGSGTIFGRNPGSPVDQINGVNINGFAAYNYTIAYTDGATVSSNSIFAQLENGDVYLIQGNGESDNGAQDPNSPWERKPIESVILTSVSNPDAGGEYTAGGALIDNIRGADLLVCFTSGTLIETDRGLVAIDKLKAGDLVLTRDCGFQPIRWIGSRRISAAELEARPNLRPIRIRAGALGHNTPITELCVSPQHRVLARSKITRRMFDTDEVLVTAKHLLGHDGIEIVNDLAEVEYFHFLFDKHQLVFSNGAETESLYTGSMALKSVSPAALEEIYAIFPELRDRDPKARPKGARTLLSGQQSRQLAARHVKNRKPLYVPAT